MSCFSEPTNSDNLVVPDDVGLSHSHCLSKHLRCEWKGEILFDQGEEPASLFRFVVGIGGRLLYKFIQIFRGELRCLFVFAFFIAKTSSRDPHRRGAEPRHRVFHAGS